MDSTESVAIPYLDTSARCARSPDSDLIEFSMLLVKINRMPGWILHHRQRSGMLRVDSEGQQIALKLMKSQNLFMKTLIVVRQPHPNLAGIVFGLESSAYNVQVAAFSPRDGCVEINGKVPIYLSYSWLSKRNYSGKKLHINGRPSLKSLIFIFAKINPEIIIVRSFRKPFWIISVIGFVLRKKVLILSDTEKYFKKKRDISLYDKCRTAVIRFFSLINLSPTGVIFSVKAPEDSQAEEKRVWLLPGVPYINICYPVKQIATVNSQGRICKNRLRVVVPTKFDNQRKQPWIVLDCLPFSKHKDKLDIIFTGFGSESSVGVKKIKESAKQIGFAHYKILFNIPTDGLRRLMQQSDLMIAPAVNEPHGMVVPEALSSGLPVLCSDTLGTRYCVIESGAGVVFRSSDAHDLADKLDQVIFDKKLLEVMKEKALQYADIHLAPAAWVDNVEKIIGKRAIRNS